MTIQKCANAILGQYWNGLLPVNPVEIANKMGFKVFTTKNLPEGQSGLCDIENRKISIREDEPHQRQRYSIAHEIAHAVLGHSSCTRSTAHALADTVEQDADSLAAEIIMPSIAIRTLVKGRHLGLDALCKAFDVPHHTMTTRLMDLGYV